MIISRRRLLLGAGVGIVAPAIVKASNLMSVKLMLPWPDTWATAECDYFYFPGAAAWLTVESSIGQVCQKAFRSDGSELRTGDLIGGKRYGFAHFGDHFRLVT